jgi:zinc protease
VILEERAQRTDSDPGSLLIEQMRAAQFLNHPTASR